MSILTNGEVAVEMLHNATFHQDLHCLLRQKSSSETIWYLRLYRYSLSIIDLIEFIS